MLKKSTSFHILLIFVGTVLLSRVMDSVDRRFIPVGESYQLPLKHTRVTFLDCNKELLKALLNNGRNQMHLQKVMGKCEELIFPLVV